MLFIHDFFSLFDQTQHITHPQYATCHSLWMKNFQCLVLLTHTDELDRLSCHRLDREGSSTPSISVHLGQDDAGKIQTLVKLAGRIHSILSGHGIGHQENFSRPHFLCNVIQLHH